METIILAGGYAKRMWPLTKDVSKALLPIGNKNSLELILDELDNIPDIDRVTITTNQKFRKDFVNFIYSYKTHKKINFIVEPTMSEKEKFGSVGAIQYALDKLKIEDDIFVISADNVINFPLELFIDAYNINKTPTLLLNHSNEQIKNIKGKYGIVILDSENRVIDFEEKPEHPKSKLIMTGFIIIPKTKIKLIRKYLIYSNSKDAVGDFISWLSKETPVYGFDFDGIWYDIGDIRFYKKANTFIKKMMKNEDLN